MTPSKSCPVDDRPSRRLFETSAKLFAQSTSSQERRIVPLNAENITLFDTETTSSIPSGQTVGYLPSSTQDGGYMTLGRMKKASHALIEGQYVTRTVSRERSVPEANLRWPRRSSSNAQDPDSFAEKKFHEITTHNHSSLTELVKDPFARPLKRTSMTDTGPPLRFHQMGNVPVEAAVPTPLRIQTSQGLTLISQPLIATPALSTTSLMCGESFSDVSKCFTPSIGSAFHPGVFLSADTDKAHFVSHYPISGGYEDKYCFGKSFSQAGSNRACERAEAELTPTDVEELAISKAEVSPDHHVNDSKHLQVISVGNKRNFIKFLNATPKKPRYKFDQQGDLPNQQKHGRKKPSNVKGNSADGAGFKDTQITRGACYCTKSRCIKLYCECFQRGLVCDLSLCECRRCQNTAEQVGPKGVRTLAIQAIMSRRPDAFGARVKKTGEGCACKKSRCLKKYCDCFAIDKHCDASKCTCTDCKNFVRNEFTAFTAAPKQPVSPLIPSTEIDFPLSMADAELHSKDSCAEESTSLAQTGNGAPRLVQEV